MNYFAAGLIGAVTYQTMVDFRLKYLEDNSKHIQEQLNIHEDTKTQRIKEIDASDPKSPAVLNLHEYIKPNGQFDHDCPVYHNGNYLLPSDAKVKMEHLNQNVNYWKDHSLFPYLREPERVIDSIGNLFAKKVKE